MHPWHHFGVILFWAAHQLSIPECNLLGTAKSLFTHLHVSFHWGKHWISLNNQCCGALEQHRVGEGDVTSLTSQSPSVLSQMPRPYHIVSDIPPYYQVVEQSDMRQNWSSDVRAFWVFYLFIYAAEFHYHTESNQHDVSSFLAHIEDLTDAGATVPECQRWEVCH